MVTPLLTAAVLLAATLAGYLLAAALYVLRGRRDLQMWLAARESVERRCIIWTDRQGCELTTPRMEPK